MIDSSEIVTRIIIVLIAIYAGIKFAAPLIQLFWEQIFRRPQKSNVNIDILIERQKQILRNGVTKAEPSPLQKQKKTDNTMVAYQKHFQDLMEGDSKETEAIEDVKKIFSLFDGLQWGEGPHFESIKKKIKETFHVDIEQWEISSVLKDILKHDFLLSRKGTNLPSYREIVDLIELTAIVNRIFDEAISNGGPFIERLSLMWKMSSTDLIKGFCLALQKENSDSVESRQKILNKTIPVEHKDIVKVFRILKSDDNKFFHKKALVLKDLRSKSEFFSILSPLEAPKDNKDLEGARKIFCIDEKASQEDVKQAYKQIAAKRHPDKLSSYDIPPDFEPIATKNFSIIQQAYDILLNEYKNNEDK